MDVKNAIPIVLLAAVLVVSGCVGQTSNNSNGMMNEMSMEESIQKMKDMMQNNPEMMNTTNNEPVSEDQGFSGQVQRMGEFRNLNYMTDGTASLQQIDGKLYVVLGEDFSTPNGPNLVVYLTKNNEPTTRDDIKVGLELGDLKSTQGKQVYELPEGTAPGQYNSVTIHCKAFNVPWSYAPFN